MFRDDYVDPDSDIPVVHFSYLLRTIVPVSIVDESAIQSSSLDAQMVFMNEVNVKLLTRYCDG